VSAAEHRPDDFWRNLWQTYLRAAGWRLVGGYWQDPGAVVLGHDDRYPDTAHGIDDATEVESAWWHAAGESAQRERVRLAIRVALHELDPEALGLARMRLRDDATAARMTATELAALEPATRAWWSEHEPFGPSPDEWHRRAEEAQFLATLDRVRAACPPNTWRPLSRP
jgi:hypothetical protein